MKPKRGSERYVAFLRGINVGGHHKIPMAELRLIMEALGFENVSTLLNSGNIIFDSTSRSPENLEKLISQKLEKTYGFPVPIIIRESNAIIKLCNDAPFQHEKINKDIRFYVSFLRKNQKPGLSVPQTSPNNSFKIIEIRETAILSVLDTSISKSASTMDSIEKFFGKDITTRNWNTIERILNKLLGSDTRR